MERRLIRISQAYKKELTLGGCSVIGLKIVRASESEGALISA